MEVNEEGKWRVLGDSNKGGPKLFKWVTWRNNNIGKCMMGLGARKVSTQPSVGLSNSFSPFTGPFECGGEFFSWLKQHNFLFSDRNLSRA